MLVDLRKKLVFPRDHGNHSPVRYRPAVHRGGKGFTALTVPWKECMVTAQKRKHLKYPGLAVQCQEAGWKARVYPVEVGNQGFVGRTVVQLLHGAGTMDSNLQKAVKELGE